MAKTSRIKIGVGLLLGCGAVGALVVGAVVGPAGLIVGGVLGIAAVGLYFLAMSIRSNSG